VQNSWNVGKGREGKVVSMIVLEGDVQTEARIVTGLKCGPNQG